MWSTKRGETRFKKSVPHICLRLNCKLYLALCQMQDPIGALFIIIKMCRIKNPRPKKNFSTSLRGWGWLSWLGPTSDPSCCWAMFFVFRRYISYFEFYVALVRLAWSINIFCSIFFFDFAWVVSDWPDPSCWWAIGQVVTRITIRPLAQESLPHDNHRIIGAITKISINNRR